VLWCHPFNPSVDPVVHPSLPSLECRIRSTEHRVPSSQGGVLRQGKIGHASVPAIWPTFV
ncbi:MAG: hypothetical protein AAGG53_07065, partial [Cyanobacteria bacterium P01_H01_bin.152]